MPVTITKEQAAAEREKLLAQLASGEIGKKEYLRAMQRDQARNRRRMRKGRSLVMAAYKPVAEWDEEELARGKPRGPKGTFNGPGPKWLPREVAEEAIATFRGLQEGRLRATVPKALISIEHILDCDEIGPKGRPLVPIQTKAAVAMFVIEHLVGKPKQRVEADISVKLQAILADVMVNPDGMPAIERQAMDADSELIPRPSADED